MSSLKVRVVRLESMRIASARALSETPERDAWAKLESWASSKGLLDDPAKHPVFGFNNPNPSASHKEYGYEFWISVDPGVSSEGEVEVMEFTGGLYAVATCKLYKDPSGSVPEVWKKLWDWAQASDEYRWRKTHELEHCRNPQAPDNDIELDLYLPVEERASSPR
jgi:DNA gyrase inhibitor GyrI